MHEHPLGKVGRICGTECQCRQIQPTFFRVRIMALHAVLTNKVLVRPGWSRRHKSGQRAYAIEKQRAKTRCPGRRHDVLKSHSVTIPRLDRFKAAPRFPRERSSSLRQVDALFWPRPGVAHQRDGTLASSLTTRRRRRSAAKIARWGFTSGLTTFGRLRARTREDGFTLSRPKSTTLIPSTRFSYGSNGPASVISSAR